mmetsp:Transcript_33844/g.95818  ORF Transcript_33844/g.95818 Transcript_33844/m.95818 type:complete len:264 (+) Transcript_33844:1032-1823(+)
MVDHYVEFPHRGRLRWVNAFVHKLVHVFPDKAEGEVCELLVRAMKDLPAQLVPVRAEILQHLIVLLEHLPGDRHRLLVLREGRPKEALWEVGDAVFRDEQPCALRDEAVGQGVPHRGRCHQVCWAAHCVGFPGVALSAGAAPQLQLHALGRAEGSADGNQPACIPDLLAKSGAVSLIMQHHAEAGGHCRPHDLVASYALLGCFAQLFQQQLPLCSGLGEQAAVSGGIRQKHVHMVHRRLDKLLALPRSQSAADLHQGLSPRSQ